MKESRWVIGIYIAIAEEECANAFWICRDQELRDDATRIIRNNVYITDFQAVQ